MSIFAASAVLIVVAAGVSRLLRDAGAPGGWTSGSLLGGVLVGVLLGLTTIGRVAPDIAINVYQGAADERREFTEMQLRGRAEIAALQHADVSPIAIDEFQKRHVASLAPLRSAVDDAARSHRWRWGVAILTVSLVWLLAGAAGCVRRASRRDAVWPGIAAGVCASSVAGGAAFLLLRWTTNVEVGTAAAFAGAMAVGGAHRCVGPARAPYDARGRSNGIAASASLAIGVVMLIAVTKDALAIVFGLGCAVAMCMPVIIRPGRSVRRAARAVAIGVALPGLAAVITAHVDLIALASTWMFWIGLACAVLITTDGRWFGGWLGWRSLGHAEQALWAWTKSAIALTAGVGGVQIAAGGIAFASGVVPASLLAAVVFGAVSLELAASLRHRIAIGLDTGDLLEMSDSAE